MSTSKSDAIVATGLPPFLSPYFRASVDQRVGLRYHLEYKMEPLERGIPPLPQRLKPLLLAHYPTPDRYARWLRELGAVGASRLVRNLLPSRDTVQAGELGEILMTDFIENVLAVPVPVYKLRHKDGRDVPLRGVDSLGVLIEQTGKLVFVKGESKVAEYITTAVIEEAREQLTALRGGIPAHAVLFTVNHATPDNYDLQRQCEAYVDRRRKAVVRHLLFAGYARIVKGGIAAFLEKSGRRRRTYAVALKIDEYEKLIPAVFKAAGES